MSFDTVMADVVAAVIFFAATIFFAAAPLLIWYLIELRQRKTRSMPGGLDDSITIPHDQEWELYHNNFSLCSKKARVCLAELGIAYQAHHIDLIETGSYENISRRYLKVNPGAILPVLIHNGHPIYESHEQIVYAAAHSAQPNLLVPLDTEKKKLMDEWIHQGSLIGDDPIANAQQTIGSAVPGLTLPIFVTMMERIPVFKVFEGLLFHRLKMRPLIFLIFKLLGPERAFKVKPIRDVLQTCRQAMHNHFDRLESHLGVIEGDWVVGDQFTLADIGLMVIFDRLDEVDWIGEFVTNARPNVSAYWQALKSRESYRSALDAFSHPTVDLGRARVVELKLSEADFIPVES